MTLKVNVSIYFQGICFLWLESLRGIIGDIFIEIVVHWVKTKLDPFESMALNYKRLHICGMNARTTSTAESMHSSMKHGINKVFSSDSTSTSAAKMMDKSILKGNEIFRYNAQELTRHRTANHSLRGTYLTDFAYKYAENEYELSKKCRGIKISNTEYHVYTKDEIQNHNKQCPIPYFYRLRKIKIYSGKYMSCSCGIPSRMKMPCRHIIYLFGNYHIEMFSLRWLIIYQYAFEREGYSDLSNIFRRMEYDEFNSNVNGRKTILCPLSQSMVFHNKEEATLPIKMVNTTDDDIRNMSIMLECNRRKKILVRGYPIEEQINIEQNHKPNHDGSMNITLSQDTEECWLRDDNFINKLQAEQKEVTKQNTFIKINTEQNCITGVRECLKIIGDDKEKMQQYLTEINTLSEKYIHETVGKLTLIHI